MFSPHSDGREEGRTDRSIDGIEREGGREGPSEYEVWKRERERERERERGGWRADRKEEKRRMFKRRRGRPPENLT